MKFILLIFCLMCSNVGIAQKKDTVLTLYKENIELKKQLTDIEKTIIRVETEYKALEKTQNTWLNAIGIVSTLAITFIVVIAALSIWRNYNTAKEAGDKASADIKTEFDKMKMEIQSSQEKLLNLNNEAELTLKSITNLNSEAETTLKSIANLNNEAETTLKSIINMNNI